MNPTEFMLDKIDTNNMFHSTTLAIYKSQDETRMLIININFREQSFKFLVLMPGKKMTEFDNFDDAVNMYNDFR